MDLTEETLKVQQKIEFKARSMTRGKLGRVLKMARKPESEEFKRTCLITLAGMVLIGFLGFTIYLIWTYVPGNITDLMGL